jgi:hypothetical protein
MSQTFETLFRAPYAAPNGLQATDDGLWIVDQLTDRVALVEMGEPHEFGATRILSEIPTESSNTSGMAYGGGSLWLTANGPGDLWRTPRNTDASDGEILRVDPATGRTVSRHLLPGGGGTHGIEYDHYEEGIVWLTTLHQDTISKVRISDWTVLHTIPLTHGGGHGIVRVEDGIWIAHRQDRIFLKLDLQDGHEMDRIENLAPLPEAHGLTAYEGDLIYCDASTGSVVRISVGH